MKTALIVDDSPLARAVLRETLAEHRVAVDEVSSAEAAIEYLESARPDVIFLDHLMPGMDGFEALHAIKADPNTATIPVMMYTSQDGKLYVSQARALGAVDVLPKSLKPADVRRVLRSYHLIEDPESSTSIEQAVRDVEQAARNIVDTARDIREQEVAELVQNLLREQTEILRAELRTHLGRMNRAPMPLSPPVEIGPQQAASWSLGKRIAAATIATLFAAATAFGSLYVHASRLLSEANGRLLAHSVVPDIPAMLQAEIPEPAAVTEPTRADPFDHASWNQYRVRRYAFDAVPLDDDLALEYGSILADLKNVGYAGPVVLDIHEGLFCVNYTSDGSVELAPSGQLAMACDRIGTRTETVSSAQQSIVFSNMLAVATRDGRLSVETVFHGAASPIVDYPALDHGVTAGDWNSVAALNQRVSFRLGREGPKLRGNRVANVERPSNLDGSVFLLER